MTYEARCTCGAGILGTLVADPDRPYYSCGTVAGTRCRNVGLRPVAIDTRNVRVATDDELRDVATLAGMAMLGATRVIAHHRLGICEDAGCTATAIDGYCLAHYEAS